MLFEIYKLATEISKSLIYSVRNSMFGAAALLLTCAGCYSNDVKRVYTAHGVMDEIGLGILKTDQVHFLHNSGLNDDSFTALIPSLRRLQITFLHLDNVAVGDSSMNQLRELSTLQVLYLFDTKVTSDGVILLNGMPNLREVQLDGLQWDQQAIRRLEGRIGFRVILRRSWP